jgi:hypothetical protein
MSNTRKHSRIFAVAAIFGLGAIATLPARAADNVYMLSIADTLASSRADGRLDDTIKLYFGDTPHPAVLQKLGDFSTNEKTNSVFKSDHTSCSWVFLSALMKLQKRAHKLGANAVVNIHSYYDRVDISSDAQIPCHVGAIMAGIALKGDFVVLSEH